MKHKFTSIFGLIVLFLLIPLGAQSRVSDEGFSIYLPLVIHEGIWQEVGAGSASGGGISNSDWDTVFPSLAVAPEGLPYVAWSEINVDSSGNEIYVRAWNGSSWAEVGAGSASGGGISNSGVNAVSPSLAVAPDGMPYVAWVNYDYIFGYEIYVRAWNGSSWAEVGAGSASGGGISNTNGDSHSPSLAIAPDGMPYVAWSDFDVDRNEWDIYVRAWNGSSWAEVGAGSASGGGISNSGVYSGSPSLAIAPDGTPYVAWIDDISGEYEYEVYVRAWNGSSWAEVGAGSASGGGISNSTVDAVSPSLAIAPDGMPYVAWVNEDDIFGHEIYVRAWNGSSWAEVGAGSASGGGISNTGYLAYRTSLAIAPDGMPYVAWDVDISGEYEHEIYVRAWNGSSWAEVGVGSASGGGISNTDGGSFSPSLAIAPDGMPYVAWSRYDYSFDVKNIYVRRLE